MGQNNLRFWILISIVAISGFSQGMLLPLIAVIFENSGISSSMNGLNATGLYIGILFIAPFMEHPLRKFGFKPVILAGGILVCLAIFLFPLWNSFWFWFWLRLIVGIGDHALHFGTQTWITTFSPEQKRGRNLSLYGLFFGVGFAIGPLMTPLVKINEALPFMLSALLCFIGWLLLLILKNEYPEQEIEEQSLPNTLTRFLKAWKYAWVAFLPPLGYGFLETSLNGSFPVYALRIGIDVNQVSVILMAFAVGAIVFQLPLGILSDKYGRKNILMAISFLGSVSFMIASLVEKSPIGLTTMVAISGMLVGSTFSLGISYMTDLMPKNLLPTGNLLCGIFYSIGSLIGPFIGGLYIQIFENLSFFYVISTVLLMIFILITFGKKTSLPITSEHKSIV